jgi:hypothetical protein
MSNNTEIIASEVCPICRQNPKDQTHVCPNIQVLDLLNAGFVNVDIFDEFKSLLEQYVLSRIDKALVQRGVLLHGFQNNPDQKLTIFLDYVTGNLERKSSFHPPALKYNPFEKNGFKPIKLEKESISDKPNEQFYKDHVIAQTVNELSEVAKQFHNHQSLRDRLGSVIVPILKQRKE